MLWREENPFAGRFQAPLTPEKDNDLKHLYVLVDGLNRAQAEIAKWSAIAASKQRNKPFVAIIFGPSGSGRSSIAKYIAYQCASAAAADVAPAARLDLLRSCFVEEIVADEHQVAPTDGLLDSFFRFSLASNFRLAEFTKQLFFAPESDAIAAPKTLAKRYALLRIDTKGSIPVPIFCLDQVRNFGQISTAIQVFDKDAIIVCTTSLESVKNDLLTSNGDERYEVLQCDLSGLTGQEVYELFEQRWRAFASEPIGSPPIDREVIQATFNYNWPIKGVVIVLNELLSSYSTATAGDRRDVSAPMAAEEVWRCIVKLFSQKKLGVVTG
jgi:hypothetical protein